MYKVYISRLVVVRSLVVPHVRHVCMLLTFVMLNMRHAHLGPIYMGYSKVKATYIWSLGYGFTCTITIGCAELKLLFVFFLYNY